MNGIEVITARIIKEAEAERDRIIGEANKEAAIIRESYAKKADEIIAGYETRIKRESDAAIERAVASSKTIHRNMALEAKSAVIASAFENAKKELAQADGKAYMQMLCGLFDRTVGSQLETEALSKDRDVEGEFVACDEYVLKLNGNDYEKYGKDFIGYAEKSAGKYSKKVVLSDKFAQIDGGFILICGDIQLDCSIGAIIESLKDELELQVLKALFD